MITRSLLRGGAGLAFVLLAAVNLVGCSCNTSNTFDQRYCEAYSDTTLGPAVAIGAAFFALTFLVWRFARRDRANRSAADARTPSAVRPTDGSSCATLQAQIASGAVEGRVLEGYDGRWLVEVIFVASHGGDAFATGWTSREAACREALDELERRGHGSPEDPWWNQ